MNKYLSYENRIIKKVFSLSEKYKCSFQYVDNIPANACIIHFEDSYIIFISKRLNKKLLPLTILHEFGHIYFKTIKTNPKKYNYFVELLSNIYAINKLLFMFPIMEKIKILLLTFISEKKLYKYYVENTKVEGELLYEKILKDK